MSSVLSMFPVKESAFWKAQASTRPGARHHFVLVASTGRYLEAEKAHAVVYCLVSGKIQSANLGKQAYDRCTIASILVFLSFFLLLGNDCAHTLLLGLSYCFSFFY